MGGIWRFGSWDLGMDPMIVMNGGEREGMDDQGCGGEEGRDWEWLGHTSCSSRSSCAYLFRECDAPHVVVFVGT